METGLITALMFGSLVLTLLMGLPLVFCLGTVAIVYTYWLWGPIALLQISTTAFATTLNTVLIAVPLFIFMAHILQSSGVAEDLYDMFYKWSGRVHGGLAVGTVIVCALFAAMSGISGPATVSMGVIAIPSMLKRKYDKFLSIGVVAAGGALGILIPPSVVMIIYAAITGVSVADLFLGGVFAGMLMLGLFIAYIIIRCIIDPTLAPGLPPEERVSWSEKFSALKSVIFPLALVMAVTGSIFSGVATPTEAAAIGAVGAVVCAAINRRLNWENLKSASFATLKLNSMVIWIVIAASCFSNVYTAVGAPDFINNFIQNLGFGKWTTLIIMQLSYFLLGMIMDPTGIILITTPVYLPIVQAMGFSPLWFGILFVINMELAYLTPPFGYNLFYMRSVVPPSVISMAGIYKSVFPFIILQTLCLIIVMMFPEIATWLPTLLK